MKRMSPARAIAYGLPGLATLFTFTMFTTYGLYFFTNIVGLSGKIRGSDHDDRNFMGMLLQILWSESSQITAIPVKGEEDRF